MSPFYFIYISNSVRKYLRLLRLNLGAIVGSGLLRLTALPECSGRHSRV